MIVRTLDEVSGTDLDVRAEHWRAIRLLTRADGLGFSLSETTLDNGAEVEVWYKHHSEACFVVEGEAVLTSRESGEIHRLRPGSVYAPEHDRHHIRVTTPLRLVCVFNPALTGHETHDEDGSYPPAEA